MYSNGVLSFISDQKLDALWYGFVDRYYWWYEVFRSGQLVSKWYSNTIDDGLNYMPEILDEIFQTTAVEMFFENAK